MPHFVKVSEAAILSKISFDDFLQLFCEFIGIF